MTDPEPQVVKLTSELIRNQCVNDGTPDSGHEHRSVTTLIDFLGRAGEIFEPVAGRQSLIYRIPGTQPEAPSLLLMGHTDVVPVTASGWSQDPFGGEIIDGQLWGRGAIDMLNLTAAMATVFSDYLTESKEPLPGDLIFLAVADEEAGGKLGAEPLVEERWDLVNCNYALTEIAYPPLRTSADEPVYPISVAEKGPFWTRLKSSGEPGHGSLPFGTNNALAPLAAAVNAIFSAPTPVVITPLWREFVEGLKLPEEMAAGLLDPEKMPGMLPQMLQYDPIWTAYAHACTHLTVSPNTLHAGVKANVIADQGHADLDIRVLPSQSSEQVLDWLSETLGELAAEIEIEPITTYSATASPYPTSGATPDATPNPLWQSLTEEIQTQLGGELFLPMLMTAGTDGRFFRQKGTIVYGAGMLDTTFDFSQFLQLFHGHDERVPVQSLTQTVDYLGGVVERFGQITHPS